MPALLMRMSSEPKVFSAVVHHVGDLGRLGHVGRRIKCPHAEILLDADAFLFDRRRVAKAIDRDIDAFSRESAGVARPMPDVEPVTRADLSFQHDDHQFMRLRDCALPGSGVAR